MLNQDMAHKGISILDDHEYIYIFSILLQLATYCSQSDQAGKILILSTTSTKLNDRLNFL